MRGRKGTVGEKVGGEMGEEGGAAKVSVCVQKCVVGVVPCL